MIEKRQEKDISSDLKNEKEEEDEVDSVEVLADEAEEENLDEELIECSDTDIDISFKTASSTASISSNEKVLYLVFSNIDKHRPRFEIFQIAFSERT